MAVQILSQSYGPRKPLIQCTADSLTELAGLVCAEGSTATVNGTEYVLDRVNGWVEPGSGGGGSGVLVVHSNYDETVDNDVLDKTAGEIVSASLGGKVVIIAPASQGMMLSTSFLSSISANKVGATEFKFIYIGLTGEIGVETFTADTQDDYPVRDV